MERKPHFLDAYVEELRASGELGSDDKLGALWYNKHGDCVMYLAANEGVYADWIDEYLTLYRSLDDQRVIGFQLKGIKGLIEEFGYDAARVEAEIEHDEVEAVTLSMILLRSFASMKATHERLQGYAEAVASVPAPAGR